MGGGGGGRGGRDERSRLAAILWPETLPCHLSSARSRSFFVRKFESSGFELSIFCLYEGDQS